MLLSSRSTILAEVPSDDWVVSTTDPSFKTEPEARFAYQHDARYISRSDDGKIEVIPSTATLPTLLEKPLATSLEPLYPTPTTPPVQILPSNHTLHSMVCSFTPNVTLNSCPMKILLLPGLAGAITEYKEDGRVLFHVYLDSQPEG